VDRFTPDTDQNDQRPHSTLFVEYISSAEIFSVSDDL